MLQPINRQFQGQKEPDGSIFEGL